MQKLLSIFAALLVIGCFMLNNYTTYEALTMPYRAGGYHTDSPDRQTVAAFQFIEYERLYTVSLTSLSDQFDTEYKEFLKAVDTLGFQ